jgi:hypothetical protein
MILLVEYSFTGLVAGRLAYNVMNLHPVPFCHATAHIVYYLPSVFFIPPINRLLAAILLEGGLPGLIGPSP